tara:strand:- start:8363 stop:8512 length:150 start_codon:yes stop_codon:yes gene_type:complete
VAVVVLPDTLVRQVAGKVEPLGALMPQQRVLMAAVEVVGIPLQYRMIQM